MTWVRFDDQFPIHRKIGGLSDALYRLHTEAIFWCARNGTNGVIRRSELKLISTRAKPARASELVEKGLWHEATSPCAQCAVAHEDAGTPEAVDGWMVHDYLSFQPSRSKVESERAAKADRQAKWLAAKKGTRRNGDASLDASQPPSRDASEDAAPHARATRSHHPAPPRPEGSGAKPRGASRPLASQGGGRRTEDENPDWRTLPDLGTPDPDRAERTRRGAAAARAALARPITQEAS